MIKSFKNWGKSMVKSSVPLLVLEGTIRSGSRGGQNLNLLTRKKYIDDAFDTESDCVAVLLNTPGGSPVESSSLYRYLKQKKMEEKKELLVFVHEVAASGGAFISCAADRIYLDESSIVGSVGVIAQHFDLSEWIQEKNVKFNVHTAGEKKKGINMFEQPTESQLQKMEDTLARLHANFQQVVASERPQIDKDKVFSGDYFVGREGIEVGLADEIGRPFEVLKQRYPDAKIQLIGHKRNPLQEMFSNYSNPLDDLQESVNVKKFF